MANDITYGHVLPEQTFVDVPPDATPDQNLATGEPTLVAQASETHAQQRVQSFYDGWSSYSRVAYTGAQSAKALSELSNIGPGTRSTLTGAQSNLTYWGRVYGAFAHRLTQNDGVTPGELNTLASQLENDPKMIAGRAAYGTDPVVGNLKTVENQVRSIANGFADRLDSIAADPRLNDATRSDAQEMATALRNFNAQEGRIVNYPEGQAPTVHSNVLVGTIRDLQGADNFISLVTAELNDPPAATTTTEVQAPASEPAQPAAQDDDLPAPFRLGDTYVTFSRGEDGRIVRSESPASGITNPVPLSDLMVPLEGSAGAAAVEIARIDEALGETLDFGDAADTAWAERPGKLGQRAFDATVNAFGGGIGNADEQFAALRNEYDGRWLDLFTARNDAVNALNSGDTEALAAAQTRINTHLKLTVDTANAIQEHIGVTAERGTVVTLMPLEITRGIVVGGGAALAGTASAPTAATFPPAPFLIAGATGATLEAGTRPIFTGIGEALFGINPETYDDALPRLDISLATAFAGGALSPVQVLNSASKTFAVQAMGNSLINLGGAYLEDGELTNSEIAFSLGAGLSAGTIDGLNVRGTQSQILRQLDEAGVNMQDQPIGTVARLGNVELTRTASGVDFRFDDGAAVTRLPDGVYQIAEGNTAALPDAVNVLPDAAPTTRPTAPPTIEAAPPNTTANVADAPSADQPLLTGTPDRPILPPASDPTDPMLPFHAAPRSERSAAPEPVVLDGARYDVMGVSDGGELILRPAGATTRDVPVAQLFERSASDGGLVGREVTLNGRVWQFDGVARDGGQNSYRLVDPSNASNRIFVPTSDAESIRFQFAGGNEYTFGDVHLKVVRMSPADADNVATALTPGQSFEARLAGRELEGVYTITVGDDGALTATGTARSGAEVRLAVEPSDIAPRYAQVESANFDGAFEVDAFTFRESELRGTALTTEPTGQPIRDPLLGTAGPAAIANLQRGPDSLRAVTDFINANAADVPAGEVPSLTVFNMGFNNTGEAGGIFDAMTQFRATHGDDAKISIVVDQGKFESFRNDPRHVPFMEAIESNNIDVHYFEGNSTAQVIHAKGVVVNDQAMLSTGAFIEQSRIKADFTVELPPEAGAAFSEYMDRAILGNASNAERQAMAADLAGLGVLVNDSRASLPYIARAQDALITGAQDSLHVSVSEISNPDTTLSIVDAAARGADVTVQYREIDSVSASLLEQAQAQFPNLTVEDVSGWQPRPHFNVVIADDSQAYVGTAYLWPNQDSMIQHNRSFETGVLLEGDAARDLGTQIDMLKEQQY